MSTLCTVCTAHNTIVNTLFCIRRDGLKFKVARIQAIFIYMRKRNSLRMKQFLSVCVCACTEKCTQQNPNIIRLLITLLQSDAIKMMAKIVLQTAHPKMDVAKKSM